MLTGGFLKTTEGIAIEAEFTHKKLLFLDAGMLVFRRA